MFQVVKFFVIVTFAASSAWLGQRTGMGERLIQSSSASLITVEADLLAARLND